MVIFTKVRCKAYMAEVCDGTHIVIYNGDGTICDKRVATTYNHKAIAYKFDPNTGKEVEVDLSDFDGSSVEKTYRKRVECNFKGVLVGFVWLDVKGEIGTDWSSDEYHEYGYCFRRITERPKVGLVYYGNNRKRFVLPEDMWEADW